MLFLTKVKPSIIIEAFKTALTHFRSMFPFYTLESTAKPLIARCFQDV